MDKRKKSDPKKILVRNTKLALPKTRFIVEEKNENTVKKKDDSKMQRRSKSENSQPKFQEPTIHSTLNIAKKIDKLEKMKSENFQKDSDLALCEKITRKINFPTDKSIYRDLIPLQVPAKSSPILSSRDPLPPKDKEPVLADYIKPSKTQEYIYQPSIKIEKPSIKPQVNNLRLYKIIQMHNQ